MEKCSFSYGKNTLSYTLLRSRRKSLQIAVLPDCTVEVKAPLSAELSKIEEKLQKRGLWILQQLEYFRQFLPRTPEKAFLSGETHLYLGRRYRLKVIEGTPSSVKLSSGCFVVTCNDRSDSVKVRKLMTAWYLSHSRTRFQKSLDRCWMPFSKMDCEKPEITIRKMTSRWGSLSPGGRMILNSSLILAPQECIDYVIIHELCHLKHREHSKEFFRLLEDTLPNWRNVKHKLELSLS